MRGWVDTAGLQSVPDHCKVCEVQQRAHWKTPRRVRGCGLNMVRCMPRAAEATVPRSPHSWYSCLILASCRPVAWARACSRAGTARHACASWQVATSSALGSHPGRSHA